NQPRPNSNNRMPIAICSTLSGTRLIAGPSAATMTASAPSAATAPVSAGRQPRKVATARMIVNDSTTSTVEATKAAPTAGAAVVQAIMPVVIAAQTGPRQRAGAQNRFETPT